MIKYVLVLFSFILAGCNQEKISQLENKLYELSEKSEQLSKDMEYLTNRLSDLGTEVINIKQNYNREFTRENDNNYFSDKNSNRYFEDIVSTYSIYDFSEIELDYYIGTYGFDSIIRGETSLEKWNNYTTYRFTDVEVKIFYDKNAKEYFAEENFHSYPKELLDVFDTYNRCQLYAADGSRGGSGMELYITNKGIVLDFIIRSVETGYKSEFGSVLLKLIE